MIDPRPGQAASPKSVESRARADAEEPGFGFRPWDPDVPYPGSSMPAQIAGKCAQLQGPAAFDRFHTAVFKALFADCRDISDGEVLLELAAEAGLDIARFQADLGDPAHETTVMAEYEEARGEFEGWGVPLAIVGGRYPVAGAAPIEMYRRAIDLCLSAERR